MFAYTYVASVAPAGRVCCDPFGRSCAARATVHVLADLAGADRVERVCCPRCAAKLIDVAADQAKRLIVNERGTDA